MESFQINNSDSIHQRLRQKLRNRNAFDSLNEESTAYRKIDTCVDVRIFGENRRDHTH